MIRHGRSTISSIILLALGLGGLYWAWNWSYLLFHSLAELFSIVIGGGIFVVAWNTRRVQTNNYLLLVGLACLFVAGLDVFHMLTYSGMGVLPGYGANLATQLWIAARGVGALTMFAAILFMNRPVRASYVLGIYGLIFIAALLFTFHWPIFPDCFVEGQGLTPFKRWAEVGICVILLATAVLLYRRRAHFDRLVFGLILASLAIQVLSETAFMFYTSPYGPRNLIGHYLKVIWFYLIYKAILETSLRRPYQLLFRDLKQRETELEKARDEAEVANRAKDHFLAMLSHELRTPLTPALMIAGALESDTHLPAAIRDDIVTLRQNLELETRLIDDLLDLTRINRGKLQLHLQTVDVHKLIQSVLAICESDIPNRRLQITTELAAHDCHVQADPARLQQILWNLLKNAVKFTPDGGRIQVQTADDAGGRILIQVSDTGRGIDPELLPKIFDAFEQGGDTTTRQFGGLGLGLAITRGLVEMHHGTITATSPGIGLGASFQLRLPTVAPQPGTDAAPSPVRPAERSLRLLLVEDDPSTARVMARLLKNMDHHVTQATGVESALQTAAETQFDLVISDLGLPDGSGLELMRQLKSRYRLPGIALSGYGMQDDVRESLEAGFSIHLTKPINLQQLESAIARIVQTVNAQIN